MKKMRERRENDGERVNLEVEGISKEEVRENMQRTKNRKAQTTYQWRYGNV